MKHTSSILTIVKDENDYLVEWVNHHIKIGFEHFYIFDNNSAIPVSETLKDFIDSGVVTVEDWKETNLPQYPCYEYAIKKYRDDTAWLAILDADEFIILNKHSHIAKFLDDYKDYPAVVLSWRLMSNCSRLQKPRGVYSVMDTYNIPTYLKSDMNYYHKTIMQPCFWIDPITDPHYFNYKAGIMAVTTEYKFVQGSRHEPCWDVACINHYYTKSFEEWQKKVNRGKADRNDKRDMGEFYEIKRTEDLRNIQQ